ncbi:MAG: hypothetical protein ABIT04_13010 [Novosphingobium sp.]
MAVRQEKPEAPARVLRTGHAGIDRALGGGLARGRLHEVFAIDAAAAASATGFAAMLARRLDGEGDGGPEDRQRGGIVWLREEWAERQSGRLYPPGLVEIGLDPARLILGVLPDPLALLRAAADVVRCAGVAAAVIELWRAPRILDLTATRRLALAAEASGVTALLLRIAAEPMPSVARTRWAVRPAPSTPLEANAPGSPLLEVELLRQRGRSELGVWRVEWNREQASFRDADESAATPSRDMVSVSLRRPADAYIVPLRRAG